MLRAILPFGASAKRKNGHRHCRSEQKRLSIGLFRTNRYSVSTSGNYEKYVIIDGVKYSHTIDPKTGYPVRGIKSVTIICSSAEISDAMATPVMVMGIRAGIHLIDQIKGIACIVIDDNDKIYTSKNINLVSDHEN